MLLSIAALISASLLVFWRFLGYLERRNYWTLRLRIALMYEYIAILCCISLLLPALKICWSLPGSASWQHRTLWQFSAAGVACVAFAFYLLHLSESRAYRRLRWKAWTGPSRTGIPSTLARYIGDERDWVALESAVGEGTPHPVEKFLKVASPHRCGVVSDPTTLLKARAALDKVQDSLWVPSNEDKSSTYQPASAGQSVSLLWGEGLGFRARCSRGILAVPHSLLQSSPRLSKGFDGRPVCLAYAILARNKGLEPSSLVFNLESKNAFRAFEESSSFWPRPSKTLRGFYRKEFARGFSLLGSSYIAAATELALLVADIPVALFEDWLLGGMEHQDIELNRKMADEGASHEDLARLYRGQYAAMLVSLSLHRQGLRLRPELLIYDALCSSEHVERPAWSLAPWATRRIAEELELCGSNVTALAQAII